MKTSVLLDFTPKVSLDQREVPVRESRVYRTEGIVLKGYNYGEADRILTLITPNNGKFRAVAKGIRKTKSRMSGHLDLFTRSTLLVARGRQLDIVTQAETIENFRGVREDLWRSSYCHYVAELLDGFSAEALPNYPLYALSVQTLRRLATVPNCDLVVRSFELQLLGHTGYRPQLHRCLGCETSIEPEGNRFSVKLGGVLCPACAPMDAGAPRISPKSLKILRNLQVNEQAMLQLPELEDEVRREVGARLNEYIAFRLESQPRSLVFLDRLRAEGVPT
jgi:DNA repair protein RecO (recombination protein O)